MAIDRIERSCDRSMKDLGFPFVKIEYAECLPPAVPDNNISIHEDRLETEDESEYRFNNSIRKLSRVVTLGERAFVCVRNRCLLTTNRIV